MGVPGEPLRGRLDETILERFLAFADRIMAVAEELERGRRSRRVIEQLIGAGTSAGAQMHEAHEALSAADFAKCVGIAAKELNETRFWLRLLVRRGWLPETRLADLLDEAGQLMRIVKAMRARTRGKRVSPSS